MKTAVLFLSSVCAAVAQTPCGSSVCISAAVFSGSGLNDATSGGRFTTTAGYHVYAVTISATGTPDHFKWSKDGGALSAAIALTGGNQVLSDGVTIHFAATTGHTLAAVWTITAVPAGSLIASSYSPPGIGSQMRNGQDKVGELLPSILDFGADPTGVSDSTAAANACIAYGYSIGVPCHFPGRLRATGLPYARYLIATRIIFPEPAANDDRVMGIVGDGAYMPRLGLATQKLYGTQIICAATYGSGDPTTGCIQGGATGSSNPHFILRDFTVMGPDSGSSFTATSNNCIMLADSVSTPRINMERLVCMGFNGAETAAFWLHGAEDSLLMDLTAIQVDGCFHLSGAFNASTVIQPTCGKTQHDGYYIEGSQSLKVIGGSCQQAQRTCVHLRGDLGVHIDGMHFEGVNAAGKAAVSALWCTAGTLFACLPTADGTSAPGSTTVAINGLGTGTIPAGSWFIEGTGRAYEITGSVAIVANAATVTISRPLDIAIAGGTSLTPLIQNGESTIVEEAGYTGAGCDSHGLHCGFVGGYNQNNSFRDVTLNGQDAGLLEFANPPGGNAVQYVNVFTRVDGCAGIGSQFFPLVVPDIYSASTRLDYCGNGLPDADPYFLSNRNRVDGPDTELNPQAASAGAGYTSYATQIGNNYVWTAVSADGQTMFRSNLYWGNTPGTDDQYVLEGSDDGGASWRTYFYSNLTKECAGIQASCSGAMPPQVVIGDGTSNDVVNIQASSGTAISVNGTHVIDSGGHIAAGAVNALPGGNILCGGSLNLFQVIVSNTGVLTGNCH